MDITANLDQLNEAVSNAAKDIAAINLKIAAAEGDLADYQRQVAFHLAEGNTQNATWARNKGLETQGLLNAFKKQREDKQAQYDAALKNYGWRFFH